MVLATEGTICTLPDLWQYPVWALAKKVLKGADPPKQMMLGAVWPGGSSCKFCAPLVLSVRGSVWSARIGRLSGGVDWWKHNAVEQWGSGASKLGRKSCRWSYVYAQEWGRKMASDSSFVPGRVPAISPLPEYTPKLVNDPFSHLS